MQRLSDKDCFQVPERSRPLTARLARRGGREQALQIAALAAEGVRV